MKAKFYPELISIRKTSTNKFRYTVVYTHPNRKQLKAAKVWPTAASAYRAAVRAAKAHHEGKVNLIE